MEARLAGICRFAAAAWMAVSVAAHAQGAADVALVSQVSGEVSYSAEGAAPGAVKPFMRVRQGDRFAVARGASIRLVFVRNARQETWRGPASIQVGQESAEGQGAARPEAVTLSTVSQQRIARVPELVQVARLGGVTVRGTARVPPLVLSSEQQRELTEARASYRALRGQAEFDDITPELILLPLLHEFEQVDEMRALLDEMKRRAPGSAEVKEVAGWLEGEGRSR